MTGTFAEATRAAGAAAVVAVLAATMEVLTPIAPASADYNDRDGGLVAFGVGE